MSCVEIGFTIYPATVTTVPGKSLKKHRDNLSEKSNCTNITSKTYMRDILLCLEKHRLLGTSLKECLCVKAWLISKYYGKTFSLNLPENENHVSNNNSTY